ncbi:MAG: hypothetical protein IPJ65_20675 [Archangiaceae bacterium]|nr:hypothetical protein [Archangiaceae bacterium]
MNQTLKRRAAWLSLLTALSVGASAYADDAQSQAAAVDDARETLGTFKQTDPRVDVHLTDAVGYAVFSDVGKGGFIIAGGGGDGVLFEKGVPVGAVTTRQVTVGAQVGGQTFSELIIFRTEQALRDFKRGRTELSAGASAVAGSQNRSKNLEYRQGVAVMTMIKGGAMAEAAVGGQKFHFTPYATVEPKPGT